MYLSFPNRYDELVAEVFNWQAISKVPEAYSSSNPSTASTSSSSPSTGPSATHPDIIHEEIPIIVPIHKHLYKNAKKSTNRVAGACIENLGFQASSEDLRRTSTLTRSTSLTSDNSLAQDGARMLCKEPPQILKNNKSSKKLTASSSTPNQGSQSVTLPSLHIGQNNRITSNENCPHKTNSLHIAPHDENESTT